MSCFCDLQSSQIVYTPRTDGLFSPARFSRSRCCRSATAPPAVCRPGKIQALTALIEIFISCTPHSFFLGYIILFCYMLSNPAINSVSHRCSPCPITENGPLSQTQHSCPAMCTFSGHRLHHRCLSRLAVRQADVAGARSNVSNFKANQINQFSLYTGTSAVYHQRSGLYCDIHESYLA